MSKEPVKFEYDIDNKEFNKLYKLLMSSLFARKQRYIYISRDTPNEAIYTTIAPETLLINKPNYEDSIHLVKTKEYDFIKLFSVYLPLDKYNNDYYCINLLLLAELIRNCKKKEITIAASKELFEDVIPNCITIVKSKKIKKVDTLLDLPVIYYTTEIEKHYLVDTINTVTSWVASAKSSAKIELDHKTILKSVISFFSIRSLLKLKGAIEFGAGLELPFTDGFSSISTSEYIKKIPGTNIVELVAGQQGNILRYYFDYTSDNLKVTSICPALFLLCKKVVL